MSPLVLFQLGQFTLEDIAIEEKKFEPILMQKKIHIGKLPIDLVLCQNIRDHKKYSTFADELSPEV